MTITVNALELSQSIKKCLNLNLVPMIHGSPGRGKSSLTEAIFEEEKLYPIVIVLHTYDVVDISGFPQIKNDIAQYIPFNIFPIESTPIPEGYTGWGIFFDEITSASLQLQAAAFRLILNRYVGQHKLHSKVKIACAGNLSTDGAVVNRMTTPMQSRLIHYIYEPTYKDWLNREIDADFRIRSYLQFKPNSIFVFNPKTDKFSFPCERSWGFVSTLIKGIPSNELCLADICGAISEAEGRQFYGYCQIFQKIPTIKDLISKPLTCTVPEEPSTLYAITGLIGEYLSNTNAISLMAYIERLPIEFQLITLRNAIKRDSSLKENRDIKSSWLKVSKQLI